MARAHPVQWHPCVTKGRLHAAGRIEAEDGQHRQLGQGPALAVGELEGERGQGQGGLSPAVDGRGGVLGPALHRWKWDVGSHQ